MKSVVVFLASDAPKTAWHYLGEFSLFCLYGLLALYLASRLTAAILRVPLLLARGDYAGSLGTLTFMAIVGWIIYFIGQRMYAGYRRLHGTVFNSRAVESCGSEACTGMA